MLVYSDIFEASASGGEILEAEAFSYIYHPIPSLILSEGTMTSLTGQAFRNRAGAIIRGEQRFVRQAPDTTDYTDSEFTLTFYAPDGTVIGTPLTIGAGLTRKDNTATSQSCTFEIPVAAFADYLNQTITFVWTLSIGGAAIAIPESIPGWDGTFTVIDVSKPG